MPNKMLLFIPSMGRSDRVITVRTLPRRWLRRCWLVVPEREAEEYRQAHLASAVNILGVPDCLKGIHNTRQFITDFCPEKYCFQLDDDMSFVRRLPKWRPDWAKFDETFQSHDAEKVGEIFDLMEGMLRTYRHVGISARQGNNHVKEREWKLVTRMNNAYGHDVDVLEDLGIRWDRLEVMEDFYVTLSLLTAGYPNAVNVDYAWNQRGSGAVGGCSSYRNNEVQDRCARELHRLFPEYVTVVTKKSKSSWQGMEERTDVRIQWKKAFENGI